jgi:hypothetical protein
MEAGRVCRESGTLSRMTDATEHRNHDTPPPMHGPLAAIMWAFFLGCSWTWVIGMFFPVLLVRDYGVWGWVAFALPNVLGAAAMGWVLKDAEVSRGLVERHGPACRWFSLVTVAYQLYLIGALAGPMGLTVAGLVALGVLVFGRGENLRDTYAAVLIFAVSVGLFISAQTTGELWTRLDPTLFMGRLTRLDLYLFVPAAVFGFALCPYLDLTFHRARQATTPGTGRAAFTIGFGVVFFSMIVFSLGYAGGLANASGHIGYDLAPMLWPVLLVQLVVQGGFTMAVHIRSLMGRGGGQGEVRGQVRGGRGEFGLFVTLALGLMLGLGALLMDGEPGPWIRWDFVTSVTELGYRGFLMLYGTVFPAYVFLCMIPTYRQVSHKAKIYVFAVAATLSYPLACVAFIANRSIWVLAIFAVIVGARCVVELLPRKAVSG